jgi:methylated-DNA-protein-cysteine methyltransferase related protein
LDEEYAEAVLDLVERIPRGRVMSYGAIAEEIGRTLHRGGPRQVARVLALEGGSVPWWRVVTASGGLPPGHQLRARSELLQERCPMHGERGDRVDMNQAMWRPMHT